MPRVGDNLSTPIIVNFLSLSARPGGAGIGRGYGQSTTFVGASRLRTDKRNPGGGIVGSRVLSFLSKSS